MSDDYVNPRNDDKNDDQEEVKGGIDNKTAFTDETALSGETKAHRVISWPDASAPDGRRTESFDQFWARIQRSYRRDDETGQLNPHADDATVSSELRPDKGEVAALWGRLERALEEVQRLANRNTRLEQELDGYRRQARQRASGNAPTKPKGRGKR